MPSKIPERYNDRDLNLSHWHRTLNQYLPYRDLDCIEYCFRCNRPLALIELAQEHGQEKKWAAPLVELAKQAKLPVYVVFYAGDGENEISSIRIRKLYPNRITDTILSPLQYELFLKMLRLRHGSPCYETQDAIALLEIEETNQDHIIVSALL